MTSVETSSNIPKVPSFRGSDRFYKRASGLIVKLPDNFKTENDSVAVETVHDEELVDGTIITLQKHRGGETTLTRIDFVCTEIETFIGFSAMQQVTIPMPGQVVEGSMHLGDTHKPAIPGRIIGAMNLH